MLTDLFLATDAELRAHYPTRRVPLETPVRKPHPFIDGRELLEWDPSPGEETGGERIGPPSPSIDAKGLTTTSALWLIRSVLGDRTPRTLDRPALFGSSEGPWIWEIPAAFVEHVARLDDAGRAQLAALWSAHEREDAMGIRNDFTRKRMLERDDAYWRGYLDLIADFAKAAIEQRRSVFLWHSL